MSNDRYLASIVMSAQDAIIGKTLDGIVTSWNMGAERMYGYSEAEMLGQPVARLAPPDRPDEIPHLMERLRRGETIEWLRTKRKRKDGTIIDVILTISPIRDIRGEIIGASTIARDVTFIRKQEKVEDRRRILAYVLMALVGILGFVRLEQITHRVTVNERRDAKRACVVANDNREVLRSLIERQGTVTVPPGADPALREAIQRSADQAAQFRAFAEERLQGVVCP